MKRASSTPTVPTFEDASDSLNRHHAAEDDHDGASDGGESANSSSTLNGSGASANPATRSPPVLVQRESKMVTRSKALVILVLLFATTLVATMTYRYTTSQEAKDFETRFNDFANQIISVYQINALNIIDAYTSFAVHVTTYAMGTKSEWPFVTLPGFPVEAGRAIRITGANTLSITPLVTPENKDRWANYTVANQGWVQESHDYLQTNMTAWPIVPFIWTDFRTIMNPKPLQEPITEGHFLPLWQTAVLSFQGLGMVNFDAYGFPGFPEYVARVIQLRKPILSYAFNLDFVGTGTPESFMIIPIFETVDVDAPIVATVSSRLPWENYFDNLVPEGIDGIHIVIRNPCSEPITYEINGPVVTFLGIGDFHNPDYDSLEVATDFATYTVVTECINTLHIFPSDTFHDSYLSYRPIYYTAAAVFIFFLTALVFVLYDCLVEKRQDKVMATATRSTAIVSSLFPETVRERMYMEGAEKKPESKLTVPDGRLGAWKTDNVIPTPEAAPRGSKPIADLFPNATVLFADIAGFTAWSSVREPTQVFTLLEAIYNSFDRMARRYKIFKVETIGDCYVAAAGLPEKMEDHAVVMARFARGCLKKMTEVTRKLETTLGPDTAELAMRAGLHSGPVTAGVLRGEKSRFQLFGDTVNTAARMESTGVKNRIQVSQATAELISAASCKDMWVKPRDTLTDIKGKGKMQTYWVEYKSLGTASTGSSILTSSLLPQSFSGEQEAIHQMRFSPEDIAMAQSEKVDRLIDWNVDVLQGLLRKIIAMRGASQKSPSKAGKGLRKEFAGYGKTVLDEVQEIITLPSQAAKYKDNPESITLDPCVTTQLRKFVSTIASMYRDDNRFHCFEHACHVSQSMTKLLSRVVTLDSTIDFAEDVQHKLKKAESNRVMLLHKYTFGITSDPITQFAVVFSALIHDVDHPGVSNAQLVKEQTDAATHYKNKSVAEQNSVDLAWELLMEPDYQDLRACIYTTPEELDRFRQVVVNAVMATDVMDKELGMLRKKRWEKAFANLQKSLSSSASSSSSLSYSPSASSSAEDANRKATIVIEHLIQASDVAHTMQHWHVYLKWNERLFHECYQAFVNGRCADNKDPSEGWYEGELGFYDFYIIPLAKKLKECGVFGVSSDEFLTYAEANRAEWALKGKDLVQGYLRTFQAAKKTTANLTTVVVESV